MAANPQQLAEYRSGKDKLFGFFVGQVMKATAGQGQSGAGQRAAEAQAGRLRSRAMTVIREDDFVQSVADALQFISYYHPVDYIEHLGRAYEREQRPRRRTRSRRS